MLTNDDKRIVSPSRTYVAMCNKSNWDGHYFEKFTLPENTDANRVRIWGDGVLTHVDSPEYQIRNDAEFASWFFLNHLNAYACIQGCLAFEDFSNVEDASPWFKAEVPVITIMRAKLGPDGEVDRVSVAQVTEYAPDVVAAIKLEFAEDKQ